MNYKVTISALVLCSAMIGAAHGQEALTVDRTIDEKGRIMVVGHDEHGRGHNLLCFHSRPDDCLPLAKGQAYPTYLLPKEDALAYPVNYVTLVGSEGTGLTCSYHMFATVIIASDPKHPSVYAMISTIDEVQAAQEHYVTGRNLLCHATTQAEQYSADHSSPKEQAELAKTCKAQGHEWTSDGQCQHNQWDAASTAGDRTQQADQQTARAQQAAVPSAAAQDIPAQLRGKWVVKRELPTSTISCWGGPEAKRLIGTEIGYTANSFRWKNHTSSHPTVKVAVVSAEQFHDENSGSGSQVSFSDLGIREAQAKQIKLSHAPANITGSTTEMPGDNILLKDKNTIIFSVCSVYFEATLINAPAAAQTQAQTQEKWVAMSHTAMSITGDITLSSDKLTMGGADYPLILVRTIDAQHLSDVGKIFDGTKPIGASLYKTNIPATAKPLKGSTVCAKGTKWLLTVKGSSPYDKKPELSLASFSGDAEPNLATATESTELCGTFTYVQ